MLKRYIKAAGFTLCLFFIQLSAVLLLAPISSAQEPVHTKDCAQFLLAPIPQLEKENIPRNKNSYTTSRNMEDYFYSLPAEFKPQVESLNENGIWLDGGAGQFHAFRDYRFYYKGKAKLIGIVNEYTPSQYLDYLNTYSKPETFFPIIGFSVEDIDTIRPHSIDLITDVWGAFTYSPHPEKVIQKYLTWLKPNGKIFIATAHTKETRTYIWTNEEDFHLYEKNLRNWRRYLNPAIKMGALPILDWLNTLPGIKVKRQSGINVGGMATLDASDNFSLPELQFLKSGLTSKTQPPDRHFLVKKNSN